MLTTAGFPSRAMMMQQRIQALMQASAQASPRATSARGTAEKHEMIDDRIEQFDALHRLQEVNHDSRWFTTPELPSLSRRRSFELGLRSYAAIQTDLRRRLRSESGRTRIPIAKISTVYAIASWRKGSPSQSDFLIRNRPATKMFCLFIGREYVRKLKKGTLSEAEIAATRNAVFKGIGGSVLAGSRRFDPSGTPRAGRWLGGEYWRRIPPCVSRSWRRFLRGSRCGRGHPAFAARRAIETAMVVDTDVHHGNGTAVIFQRGRNGLHPFDPPSE